MVRYILLRKLRKILTTNGISQIVKVYLFPVKDVGPIKAWSFTSR